MNFSRWSFQGWVKITILNLKSGPLWLTRRPPSISGPWSFMSSSHQVLWRSRVKWIDLVKVVAKECRATKLNQIRNSSDCSEVYFLHSCNNIIPRGRNWVIFAELEHAFISCVEMKCWLQVFICFSDWYPMIISYDTCTVPGEQNASHVLEPMWWNAAQVVSTQRIFLYICKPKCLIALASPGGW